MVKCIFAASCKKRVTSSKTQRTIKCIQSSGKLSKHKSKKIEMKEQLLVNYEENKSLNISYPKQNCEGHSVHMPSEIPTFPGLERDKLRNSSNIDKKPNGLSLLNEVKESVQHNAPLEVKAVEPSTEKLETPNEKITSVKWSDVVKGNLKYNHHLSNNNNPNYFQVLSIKNACKTNLTEDVKLEQLDGGGATDESYIESDNQPQIVKYAIRSAKKHGINVVHGKPNAAKGNCAFESVIYNINYRKEYENTQKIEFSVYEARTNWITELQSLIESDYHYKFPDQLSETGDKQ